MVDQCPVGFMADRRNQRDIRLGRRAHHRLIVETPEILQTATAAGDDDQVRPGNGSVDSEGIEPFDRPRHFLAGCFALHPHRPDDHMDRKPVFKPVENVANHRACG